MAKREKEREKERRGVGKKWKGGREREGKRETESGRTNALN